MAIALVCLALTAAAAVLVWAIRAALHTRARRARIARREVLADYTTCLATTTDDRAAAAVLHELDDLAHSDPALRQAAVDGFCAYLRRPAPPGPMQHDATGTGPAAQARTAAVQLLQTHLRRSSTGRHWPDMYVNLDRADVADLDLSNTALRSGSFAGTRFSGTTRFTGARCSGRLAFTAATFTGPVLFDHVDLHGAVRLDGPDLPARRRSPRPPSTAASTSPQRCSPLPPTSPLRGSSATPPSTTRAAGRHSSPPASSSIDKLRRGQLRSSRLPARNPLPQQPIPDAPACRGPRLHPLTAPRLARSRLTAPNGPRACHARVVSLRPGCGGAGATHEPRHLARCVEQPGVAF